MKVLIINGPNLNLLGKRDPQQYGNKNLNEVNAFIKSYFKKVELTFSQFNSEGAIVEALQQADGEYDGVVLNAAAYTHYSIAIHDAIEAITLPVVEVHISNIAARESFRHHSVISRVCQGSIVGLGIYGYVLAVQALAHNHKRKK